jgi:hypothetical protein
MKKRSLREFRQQNLNVSRFVLMNVGEDAPPGVDEVTPDAAAAGSVQTAAGHTRRQP